MLIVYPRSWKGKERRNCVNGLIGGKRRSLSFLMLLAPRKAVSLRSQRDQMGISGILKFGFDFSFDAEPFY